MTGFYEGDGTEAEPIPHGLNTHTDVDLVGLQDQQVLKYSSSTGNWYNGFDLGGTQIALDDLTDTEVPAPSDGNALVWNSTAAKWVDATIIAGAAGQLSDLSDVQWNGSPAEGEIMFYTGGIWTNADQSATATIPNPLKVGNDIGDANMTLAGGGGVSDSCNISFNRDSSTVWIMTVDDTDAFTLRDTGLGTTLSMPRFAGGDFDTVPLNVLYGGLNLGKGTDFTSIGITLNSGSFQDQDENSIAFKAGAADLYTLKTGLVNVNTGTPFVYNLGLYDSDSSRLMLVETNILAERVLSIDNIAEIFIGDTQVTKLTLNNEITFNASLNTDGIDTGYRVFNRTSANTNQLRMTSTGASGTSDISLEVKDSSDVRREFLFRDNGILNIPGILDVKGQASGDSAGLWVENFDWASGDGGYLVYAANGVDTDTQLVISPQKPSSIGSAQYSGEVSIYVGGAGGSGGGTTFGWQFGRDGALWRWDTASGWQIVIPAP